MTETTVPMPVIKSLPIGEVRPYPGNPRRIPDEAVAAVRTSLERYGYNQPIVVDKDHVVVVGHTRLRALTDMGVENVDVYVTDLPEDKVREYRLVDNRTSEMSAWDEGTLIVELREFEQDLLAQFFPEVNLEITTLEDQQVTDADVERATKKALEVSPAPEYGTTSVVCPSCFHSFEVRTNTLPGLSQDDVDVIRDGASE